jgi:hypothetical protein
LLCLHGILPARGGSGHGAARNPRSCEAAPRGLNYDPAIINREEYCMKIRSIVVAVSLALASGGAFAFTCPKEMKAIDAALPMAKLSEAQMSDVKKLRAGGESLHKAGKHSEALESLGKAKKILGI